MNENDEIAIVIPAYEPDEKLVTLVDALARDFARIIVVDDGSSAAAGEVFRRIAPSVTLLTHATNRGKGAALKTAFRKVLDDCPAVVGVVTVDADGQHLPADIRRVAAATREHPDRYVIGVRAFSGKVPLRSRFGNAWTRYLFLLLTGVMVYDTQTGLRGLPRALLGEAIRIGGDRYEYEMRALVAAARRRPRPLQLPIETVYIEGNRTSHFHPLRDSLRTQAALLAARFSRP